MRNLSLANTSIQVFPRPLAPVLPDFGICDRRYGQYLTPLMCGRATNTLLQGDTAVEYPVYSGRGPQYLPYTTSFGNCKIWVEVAGPAVPQVYTTVPDEIRGMTGWILDQCVGNSRGSGGFVTKDIGRMTSYVVEPEMKTSEPYPPSSAFLTVTVTGPREGIIAPPSPGNFDPLIAELLAQSELEAWNQAAPGSSLRKSYGSRWDFFNRHAGRMATGGSSITWWNQRISAAAADTLTYECGASLGSPDTSDCARIEWGKLVKANRTIDVGPGSTKFFSFNTCRIAVSATNAASISWHQIQTALFTLIHTCVTQSTLPARGGRAYYSAQPIISSQKKKRQGGLTRFSALPQGVSITIFTQSSETWQANPMEEKNSCTWQAILHGKSIASCSTA